MADKTQKLFFLFRAGNRFSFFAYPVLSTHKMTYFTLVSIDFLLATGRFLWPNLVTECLNC